MNKWWKTEYIKEYDYEVRTKETREYNRRYFSFDSHSFSVTEYSKNDKRKKIFIHYFEFVYYDNEDNNWEINVEYKNEIGIIVTETMYNTHISKYIDKLFNKENK